MTNTDETAEPNEQSPITDDQIHRLHAWAERRTFTEAGSISQLCGFALGVLSPEAPGYKPQDVARAGCAAILRALVQRGILDNTAGQLQPAA